MFSYLKMVSLSNIFKCTHHRYKHYEPYPDFSKDSILFRFDIGNQKALAEYRADDKSKGITFLLIS